MVDKRFVLGLHSSFLSKMAIYWDVTKYAIDALGSTKMQKYMGICICTYSWELSDLDINSSWNFRRRFLETICLELALRSAGFNGQKSLTI